MEIIFVISAVVIILSVIGLTAYVQNEKNQNQHPQATDHPEYKNLREDWK